MSFQDKNLKSPKDFESSKPGFQEFHHIKEEKPEIKEEKQQFNCGFSGGQVSYNYRSYSGYSEYPYPSQEYQPPWNKGNFSNFSQDETSGSGNLERTASKSGSSITVGGDQKNTYSNSNQPDSVPKLNTSEDRSHGQSNQAASHIHERNQSNQNINETNSLHSSSDQQRLISNQDHSGGTQNLHGNIQANNMVMMSDDQHRRTNQGHVSSSQQGLFMNQRSDNSHDVLSRSHDNLIRSRNNQEMELNRLHANSHMVSSQGSHGSHDQLHVSQQSMYGNKTQDNEYRTPCNQEHQSGQSVYSNFQSNKDYMMSNQNLNMRPNMSDECRVQGNQDQTLIHQPNNFNTQRAEHMMHGEHVSNVQNIQDSQVRMQNPQERVTGPQTSFSSQELQKSPRSMQSIHDVQHRGSGTQDHITSSQQNLYGNQRTELTLQSNQEHISSSQHNMFSNLRSEHNMKHINQEQTSKNQKSMFGNQRGEHNIQVNPDNLQSSQNVYLNPRNEHSMPRNQENMPNTPTGVYGTHRGDHGLQEQLSASQHNMSTNQRSESNTVNPDHLINSQQNLYGNQLRNEHSVQNNPEHMAAMQQNIYNKERGDNMQLSSEQPDLFSKQRSELNIHGNNSGSQQQNLFNNIRTDHGMSVSQDRLSYNQQNLGSQTDNQQRVHIGSEHMTMNNQHMFSGRNEHGTLVSQEHLQQSQSGDQEKDVQHRITSQDRLSGNHQMFGNGRNELIQSNSDRRHRHQEGFVGNQNIHELDSKSSSQNINPVNSQSMYAGQRVDQSMHMTPEESSQQNIPGVQERINPDRFSGGHNIFGNQDDIYRGQNIHENQHKLQNQMTQQNIYGNQFDCSSMRSSDMQGNAQAVSSQNHHQATKRSSNNDHMSVVRQQESFDHQGNDHSMQKIMKTDNQQKVRSVQECNPSQFNMFPNPDGQFGHSNNQETMQNCRTNLGERQNPQESSSRMHLNVDRSIGNQPHVQDQKHANQNYFTNQSIHDQQRWIHNNQQLSGSQQNIYDNRGTVPRDDSFQTNQNLVGGKVFPDNQQQFHSSQECGGSVPQQGMFSQSNQSNNQRQDQSMVKSQNIQENQYRMSHGQDAHMRDQQQTANNAERQQALQNKDSMHGSPQNIMSRKNSTDHLSSQGMANNSGMYMNQLQHNMQGNRDYMLSSQCGSGSISDVSSSHGSMHVSHQQSGMNINQNQLAGGQHISINNHELQKGSQNISTHQNYALQNSQIHSSLENHQGNQSSLLMGQQNILNNQGISRPQNNVMNSQEIPQGNSNENIPGNHHSIYENQFHIQSNQQTLQCMPSQHMQGPSQQNLSTSNAKASMFGNQGTSQNIQCNQSHLQTSQQKLISGSSTSSLIHNKDMPQGSHSIPNFSGHYQQNIPVSSHLNMDHLQNSKININSNLNVPASQHNIQSQSTGNSQTVPVNKNDLQKMQGSPPNVSSQHKMKCNQGLSVNQQGTQTGSDHSSSMAAAQHNKVQNILSQGGMASHQQSQNSFDQTIIMSNKGMSGGQMIQSSQQQKLGVQSSAVGMSEDQSRFTSRFNESFMKEQFQGNFNKSGFFGQDYQFPYQKELPYQDKQFNEPPGPSGQHFRKEDDVEEGKSKETESSQKNRDAEEGIKRTCNSSTNTERDEERDKKEKRDDDDKTEKKETTSKSNKEDPGIPYDWVITHILFCFSLLKTEL